MVLHIQDRDFLPHQGANPRSVASMLRQTNTASRLSTPHQVLSVLAVHPALKVHHLEVLQVLAQVLHLECSRHLKVRSLMPALHLHQVT